MNEQSVHGFMARMSVYEINFRVKAKVTGRFERPVAFLMV